MDQKLLYIDGEWIQAANDLLLVDANDAHAINQPDAPDITAWALHSEIHKRNRGARCVLHVHSKFAAVLSCLKDPVLSAA